MPSLKVNYLTIHKNDSQVYAAAKKDIALASPLPAHTQLEDRRVFFVSYEPDNEQLTIRQIPQEEVMNAEIKVRATPKKATADE